MKMTNPSGARNMNNSIIKLLIILGWILQALIGAYCIFAIFSGVINLAILLMFCLYVVAFTQQQIEFYYKTRCTHD